MITAADIHIKTEFERRFCISEYHPDEDGKMIPEIPDVCILQDEKPCKIVIHHLRSRKTGVSFDLFVLQCKMHNIAFTVYPPGFLPYLRKPLAPVSPEGRPLLESADEHFFEGTYFDAALDASGSVHWPKESDNDSLAPRLTTQGRQLKRACRQLGIEPGTDPQISEQIGQILMAPGQVLYESKLSILETPDYLTMGRAICAVLEVIPRLDSLFERLSEAGACAGILPVPLFWNEGAQRLRYSRFRTVQVRGSPTQE